MPCTPVKHLGPSGHVVTAIVCGSRGKSKPCAYCGKPSAVLCDGPGKEPEKTCDVAMCVVCTWRPSAGVDHCREHRSAEVVP